MSMTMTLVPVVIALGSTVSTASLAALCKGKGKSVSGISTVFTDREMLLETLKRHGLCTAEKGADHIVVMTADGEIHYEREADGEPYILRARGVTDVDRLAKEIREFEDEYGRNVQAYTYNKIMEALDEHGLFLQTEEVLEDDSIVLTLTL